MPIDERHRVTATAAARRFVKIARCRAPKRHRALACLWV